MKLAATTSDFAAYLPGRIPIYGFKFWLWTDHITFFSDDAQRYIDNIRKAMDELSVEFVQSHASMTPRPAIPIEEDNDSFVIDNINVLNAVLSLAFRISLFIPVIKRYFKRRKF